jgi:hypothetical protein
VSDGEHRQPLRALTKSRVLFDCTLADWVRPALLGLVLVAGVACTEDRDGGYPDAAPANPCSPRLWDFHNLDGVRFDPTTAIVDPGATLAPGPVFGGERTSALRIPVKLDPFEYSILLTFEVCRPSDAGSLLDQKFSVRFLVEGAPVPPDAALNVYVWPRLDGTDVPLRIKNTDGWIGYEGTFAAVDPDERSRYRNISVVTVNFLYEAVTPWAGTIWMDDLRIEPPAPLRHE